MNVRTNVTTISDSSSTSLTLSSYHVKIGEDQLGACFLSMFILVEI